MTDDERDDGGRAFPVSGGSPTSTTFGMTLRDWFAGQALALLAPLSPMDAAIQAYKIADAMLEARKQ